MHLENHEGRLVEQRNEAVFCKEQTLGFGDSLQSISLLFVEGVPFQGVPIRMGISLRALLRRCRLVASLPVEDKQEHSPTRIFAERQGGWERGRERE